RGLVQVRSAGTDRRRDPRERGQPRDPHPRAAPRKPDRLPIPRAGVLLHSKRASGARLPGAAGRRGPLPRPDRVSLRAGLGAGPGLERGGGRALLYRANDHSRGIRRRERGHALDRDGTKGDPPSTARGPQTLYDRSRRIGRVDELDAAPPDVQRDAVGEPDRESDRLSDASRASVITPRRWAVAATAVLAAFLLASAPRFCAGADAAARAVPTIARADSLFARQDWKGAAAAYEAIAKEDPENGFAWFRLGASLRAGGDYEGAIDAYTRDRKS